MANITSSEWSFKKNMEIFGINKEYDAGSANS